MEDMQSSGVHMYLEGCERQDGVPVVLVIHNLSDAERTYQLWGFDLTLEPGEKAEIRHHVS